MSGTNMAVGEEYGSDCWGDLSCTRVRTALIGGWVSSEFLSSPQSQPSSQHTLAALSLSTAPAGSLSALSQLAGLAGTGTSRRRRAMRRQCTRRQHTTDTLGIQLPAHVSRVREHDWAMQRLPCPETPQPAQSERRHRFEALPDSLSDSPVCPHV